MKKPIKARIVILVLSITVITGASCIPEIQAWTPRDSDSPIAHFQMDNVNNLHTSYRPS